MIRPLRFDQGPPDSPPDPPEPPEDEDRDRCPGCDSWLDDGCPVDCPERALDDDADAYTDRLPD